ncbi:MAG: hypothetical protein ACI91B_002514 [Planctomycetota bacterium]|jgi:hypothetical protein
MQMRFIPILVLSCAAVSAQQSLTTTFANNNAGAAGGGVYFTLTAGASDVTVTDCDFNLGAGTGSIDIYTTPGTHAGNETNMALWTNVATAPVTSTGPGGTNGVLSVPLVILAGTSVGVAYVDGTLGTAHTYTTGTAPFPLQYSGCGLTLDAGTASNSPFTGGLFSPRVVNTTVNYTATGSSCASIESIGDGCTSALASVYELTTLDVFGLSNTMAGIDFISTGGGFVMTPAAGAIAAVGSLDPAATPLVGVGDDAVVPVGTLGLECGSNGWLATGTGNSNQWAPNPAVFLNNPAAQFSCWSDFQPNTGGTLTYEEAGTIAQLTYTDVLAWGTTDLCTFQFYIDTATGSASLYFGAMASATAHPMMIGYSPAGPNSDPGSISLDGELTANGAIVLANGDTIPLNLVGSGRPVMTAAAASYDAVTSNIEAGAIFHIGVVGLSNPGLPLSLIGFDTSCTLYAAADVLVGPAVVAGGPGDLTWSVIGLPAANPVFNGFVLHAQGVTMDLSLNSGTARASNGIKLTLGDL